MKNILTHVVSAVIILTVGFAAGNSYHHQQVTERAQAAHVAAVKKAEADQKAKAAAKAKADALAAQQAAAAQKARTNVVVPKTTTAGTAR